MPIQPYLATYNNLLLQDSGAQLVGRAIYNDGTYYPVTCTRSTDINVLDTDGYYTTYTANQVPIYNGIGVLAEPSHTNSLDYSTTGDFTVSATKTTSQTDILGGSTGVNYDDQSGSVSQLFTKAYTVANDSNNVTLRFFIPKDSDETRFPQFRVKLSGGTEQRIRCWVNTKTGATSTTGSVGTTSSTVEEEAGRWKITLTVSNNSSGNTTATIYGYPAFSTTLGGSDVSATGGVTIMHADLFLNTSHNIARFLSPIVTSGAPVTVNAAEAYATDLGSIPDTGLFNVSIMTFFDRGDIPNLTDNLVSFNNASNHAYLSDVNGSLNIYQDAAGTATASLASFSAGDTLNYSAAWNDSTNEMQARGDDWSSVKAADISQWSNTDGVWLAGAPASKGAEFPVVFTSASIYSAPTLVLAKAKAEELYP